MQQQPEKLAVVAFPEFAGAAETWIADRRARFPDLQTQAVPPHFTLVFPLAGVAAADLDQHVRRVTEQIAVIPFVIRCCLPVKDSFSDHTHIFLTPDEGFSAIIKLHDRLYTDSLQSHLRLDIPFIPHITLGYAADSATCKRVVDALNAEAFTLSGSIDHLALLRVTADGFSIHSRIALKTS